MEWSDKKKWQMDLLSKVIVALIIAIIAAAAAIFIEHKLQLKLEQERAESRRIDARTETSLIVSTNFLEVSMSYADAYKSAFYDVIYQGYNANNKSENQKRYENNVYPKLESLIIQMKALCPATIGDLEALKKVQSEAFCFYNLYEGSPKAPKCTKKQNIPEEVSRLTNLIKEKASNVYNSSLLCLGEKIT